MPHPHLADSLAFPRFLKPDRIAVVGSSRRILDLLRIATVRSDDVVLFAAAVDAPTRRFADHFAIEVRRGPPADADLDAATAVLVSTGEMETENRVVRAARRLGVPVHVAERPLVSDFTLLELVERHPSTLAPAP